MTGTAHRVLRLALMLLMLIAVSALPATAQFVSGSDGSDGTITFALPSGQSSWTFQMDPRTVCQMSGVTCSLGAGAQLDPNGDNIYHFGSVTVNTNVTVHLRASRLRHTGAVIWLATGDVTINGTVDLNGAAGHVGGQTTPVRSPSEPGPGGFPGGAGAKPGDGAQRGAGPGGGVVADNSSHGCSAGHVVAAIGGPLFTRCTGGGMAYGTTLVQPLIGGSGGSGGHYSGTNQGSGGGAGGGAIRISSSGTIRVGGHGIFAQGANPGGAGGGYLGGAGSGGAIHLQARTVTILVVDSGSYGLRADGGIANTNDGNTYNVAANGRIRIDADTFTQANGTIAPTPVVGPAIAVPLPATPATVRLTSIAGMAVPEVPNNEYTLPDIPFDSAGPVNIEVQATNIPVGTVLRLHVISEGSGSGTADQVVTTALAGTLAASTATASVTLPQGVSRLYLRATW